MIGYDYVAAAFEQALLTHERDVPPPPVAAGGENTETGDSTADWRPPGSHG